MNHIEYSMKRSSLCEIISHLKDVDGCFSPVLSSIVNLEFFAKKIYDNTIRFEAWNNDKLIGLLSAYFNNYSTKNGFINHVAVKTPYNGQGISKNLMNKCIEYGINNGFESITLEVSKDNYVAINLYERFGFVVYDVQLTKIQMITKLIKEEQ